MWAQSFIMHATMEMNATKDSYSRHYDYTTGSTATTDVNTKFEGSGTENWCEDVLAGSGPLYLWHRHRKNDRRMGSS